MKEKECSFLSAAGNRCSITDHKNKCLRCDVVTTAVAYIKELKDSDAWQEKARDYWESGNCPICFCTDEAGHDENCFIQTRIDLIWRLQTQVNDLKKKVKVKEGIITAANGVAQRKVFRTADKMLLRSLLGCCIECGCTEDDCIQCIEAQGKACHWVAFGKCSRCFDSNGELKQNAND